MTFTAGPSWCRRRLAALSSAAFLAGVFLAAAFLAVAFLAGAFLAVAFFARRLLVRLRSCSVRAVGQLVVRPVLQRVEVQLADLGDAFGQVVDASSRRRGSAGYTATSTVPGLKVLESRAAMTSALRITIGTIGMPAAIAIRNGPFLNGPDLGGVQPGALGGDQDRQSLAGKVFHLLQSLDGRLRDRRGR